jgi:hypothetical protein
VRSPAELRRAVSTAGAGIVSLPGRAVTRLVAERDDSAEPHSEQKFCPGAVSWPQSGHDVESADPHSMQNFAPG